jgi:hypothetical protein
MIPLTIRENTAIDVVNELLTYDGIITSEEERRYLAELLLAKFVSKKKIGLLRITETAYPMRVVKPKLTNRPKG